jgi:hypothetical protein
MVKMMIIMMVILMMMMMMMIVEMMMIDDFSKIHSTHSDINILTLQFKSHLDRNSWGYFIYYLAQYFIYSQ